MVRCRATWRRSWQVAAAATATATATADSCRQRADAVSQHAQRANNVLRSLDGKEAGAFFAYVNGRTYSHYVAEIQKLTSGCGVDCDDDCEREEHGKRGKRGK